MGGRGGEELVGEKKTGWARGDGLQGWKEEEHRIDRGEEKETAI